MLASMLGLTDGCGMLRSVVTPQDTPEGRLLPPTHDHEYNAWMPRVSRYQPMDCVGDATLASFCEPWRTPLKSPQEFLVRDRELMRTEHEAGRHVTSDTSWGLKEMRTEDSNKTLAHLLLREMVDDDMPVSATGAILYVREGVGTDDASDLTVLSVSVRLDDKYAPAHPARVPRQHQAKEVCNGHGGTAQVAG